MRVIMMNTIRRWVSILCTLFEVDELVLTDTPFMINLLNVFVDEFRDWSTDFK